MAEPFTDAELEVVRSYPGDGGPWGGDFDRLLATVDALKEEQENWHLEADELDRAYRRAREAEAERDTLASAWDEVNRLLADTRAERDALRRDNERMHTGFRRAEFLEAERDRLRLIAEAVENLDTEAAVEMTHDYFRAALEGKDE